MLCKKTRGEPGVFLQIQQGTYANNQLEECWSHVSVCAGTVLYAAESWAGDLKERVTGTTVTPHSQFSIWGHGELILNQFQTLSQPPPSPNLSVKMLTSSNTENINFTSLPYTLSAWLSQEMALNVGQMKSSFANWWSVGPPSPQWCILFGLDCVFKNVMSCQHVKLRKFHIKKKKSTSLVSLKILEICSS